MTILIDPPVWPAHGRVWSHLVSDTSLEELHAFAAAAGIPRRSFEGDHYDVPGERYDDLVAAGATPVGGRDLARALRASGLRFRKRRGERPLGRLRDPDWLPVPGEVDVLASTREPPEESTGAADVVVLADGGTRVLLVRNAGRGSWSPPGGGRERPESVRACAVRETAEETGLDLGEADLVPVGYLRVRFDGAAPDGWRAASGAGPEHHVAVYAVDVGSPAPDLPERSPDPEGEILDLRWATRDEAERVLDPPLAALVRVAVDRLAADAPAR